MSKIDFVVALANGRLELAGVAVSDSISAALRTVVLWTHVRALLAGPILGHLEFWTALRFGETALCVQQAFISVCPAIGAADGSVVEGAYLRAKLRSLDALDFFAAAILGGEILGDKARQAKRLDIRTGDVFALVFFHTLGGFATTTCAPILELDSVAWLALLHCENGTRGVFTVHGLAVKHGTVASALVEWTGQSWLGAQRAWGCDG